MIIKEVEVSASNLMEVILDKSNYVIRKRYSGDEFVMQPIMDAEIKQLLDKDTIVIKIVED